MTAPWVIAGLVVVALIVVVGGLIADWMGRDEVKSEEQR